MFPISMHAQRAHLVDALARIVASVDSIDELTAFLQDLGRGHRKFGTLAAHYDAVGASLLATFAHFSGEAWDTGLEDDWRAAYQLVAGVTTAAARADEQVAPAYWSGRVVACERMAFDITSLTVQTRPRLEYRPGQSAAIESPRRPRLWRYYSMANAPRDDGTVDFHIRLVDGGPVSMALTTATATGDELRLGPPAASARIPPRAVTSCWSPAAPGWRRSRRSSSRSRQAAAAEGASGLRGPARRMACMTSPGWRSWRPSTPGSPSPRPPSPPTASSPARSAPFRRRGPVRELGRPRRLPGLPHRPGPGRCRDARRRWNACRADSCRGLRLE